MRIFLLFLLTLSLAFKSSALEWQPPTNGDFALKFADGASGFWVGTEDKGLWHRRDDGTWENISIPVGEGKEVPAVTALATRGEQLWIGTGRDGVFVLDYDGDQQPQFKSFSTLQGLPDNHINEIEVDENKVVWIATDKGLISYDDTRKWRDFSRDTQKIDEQIVAVAVKEKTVLVATACDSLRISRDGGDSFERIEGPKYQPNTPSGTGLPSQIINDVCFDSLGNAWVATDFGIARSNDDGKSWFFLRGADWKENVEGSAQKFKPKPVALNLESGSEDWVQCLHPTDSGQVWLGFRQKGAEMRDAATGELLYATWSDAKLKAARSDFNVRDIYPTDNGSAILALYGGGIASVLGGDFPESAIEQGLSAYALPVDISAVTVKAPVSFKSAIFEGIDRQTRGDWEGKYGTQLAEIYYVYKRQDEGYSSRTTTGLHRAGANSDCYVYIHWASSENPNVLYAPNIKTRRQAEINDGTWNRGSYPLSFDGPGLVTTFALPEGTHRISSYWFNKDGRSGDNRYRDHVVRLKKVTHEADEAQEDEELAKCRLYDGWNGQYANFLVKGPGKFRLEMERHRSHGTILQGFFIDKIAEAAQ